MAYPLHQRDLPVCLLEDEEWKNIWEKAKIIPTNKLLLLNVPTPIEFAKRLALALIEIKEKEGYYKNVIEQ
jgi:hypothetical protein